MEKTFKKLATHLEKSRSHEYIPGRSTKYEVVDLIVKGQHLATTTKPKAMRGEYEDSEWEDEIEDEIEEVGDLEDM